MTNRRVALPLLASLATTCTLGCAFERKYFTETARIRTASEAFRTSAEQPVPIAALNGAGRPVTVLLRRDVSVRRLGDPEGSAVDIEAAVESQDELDVVVVPSRTKSALGTATLVAGLALVPLAIAAGVLTAKDPTSTETAAVWGTYGGTLAVTVGLGLALGFSSGIDDDELPR